MPSALKLLRSRGGRHAALGLALLCLGAVGCKPKLADLVMTVLAAPVSAPMGDPIAVSLEICNRGPITAEPSIAVLLLRPAGQPAPEFFLDGFPVPELTQGACHRHDAVVQTPFSEPDGAYDIVAIADPDEIIPERALPNNTDSREIGLGWGPDLVVKSLSGPPASLPASPMQVQAEVCNQGTDWSNLDTDLLVVLSEDDVISVDGPEQPDWPAGSLNVPVLAPGACASFSDEVHPGAPDGVYTLGGLVDQGQTVSELIETNNASPGDIVAIGYGPDLVVSSVSGPPSAEMGGPFEVSLEVCNQGTGPSDWTGVAVHLSADAVIAPAWPLPEDGDPQVGSFGVPPLLEGACHGLTETVHASVPTEGAWYLGAFVDETDGVAELREDNNGRAGAQMGVGWGPDYVIASLEAPPSSGDTFDAEVRVCNQGTAPGGDVDLALFLSSDAVLDPIPAGADPEVGAHPVSGLGPGECVDLVVLGHAAPPPPGDPGPYHLFARVDSPDFEPELIETNNDRAGPVMGIGWEADLVVTAVSGPSSALEGASFDGSATVCNQGTVTSPASKLAFFLSADEQIQGSAGPPGAYDYWAGEVDVPTLSPGVCAGVGGSLWASAWPPGAWYLGAYADELQQVTELIETNNTRAGALMGVGSGPDLVVASISGPASSTGGTDVDLDWEVCNQGTMPAPASQLDLYASDDATIEGFGSGPLPEDWPLAGAAVPPLGPGACHAATQTVWIPSEVSGPTWLGGIVDETGDVAELVEANNALAGHLMGVGSAPDFVVTSLVSDPTSLPSGPLQVTVEVCNVGTTPGSADVAVFLSEDTDLDGSVILPGEDPLVDLYPLPPLAPGDCDTHLGSVFPGVPDGEWHLLAVADPDELEPELREDNNQRVAGPVGIGLGPDLVVTSLVAPDPVSTGIAFPVTAEVCNQGTDASPVAHLALYHSADADVQGHFELPGTPDVFLDAQPVNPLLPGECAPVAMSVSTWVTPGTWHVGAIIDEDDSVAELLEGNNEAVAAPHDVLP